MLENYDVIVVGAGHAGCEAAAAAANLGSKTLLITIDMNKIAQMSCNPAMGGIAKGQIVREIDALGGYSGIVTDKSMIQFRMLNSSKGPAMWSPRAQCDRIVFSTTWRNILESLPNLDFLQDSVVDIITEADKIAGVITNTGIKIRSKAVILTTGTFLNGLIHIGYIQMHGGRISEPNITKLTENLQKIGFVSGRMKTGTPVRIDGRSLDFSKFQEQNGDKEIIPFSYSHNYGQTFLKQRSCFITYTNSKVHEIIRKGLKKSPLYNGTISSIGPRYCPSIETKIVTFSERERHQLFIEPEGETTIEYYLNGFSSSLPWEIQIEALKKIEGFENVKIFRPGYAIEYDYFPPTQLLNTLETKILKNLYFAGQINGTTGYEEAGGQGIIAGINAHLKINKKEEFTLRRDEAYIGVLIDDLVTKGTDEPYRMFTSRAEFRLLLRQDNCDIRLTEKSNKIGLASDERVEILSNKINEIDNLIKYITKASCNPKILNPKLKKLNSSELTQSIKLLLLINRPEIKIKDIIDFYPEIKQLTKLEKGSEIVESAEILIKYKTYIEKEKLLSERINKLENIKIENKINYSEIKSLSIEAREKLSKINPKTIGQASRISGVSPADINVLIIYLNK
ncbi:MAG: tRNA uridine-5-carboxymethylaminomethyl(34) synthesis enzyme MnmG [Bacteroidales bacterium]|jgi:tRNA uridine 5-carboxymethylaminomethyl modification enzyme|nr:tRNA uridine-5-carboxymethylaminomethyl(34) synthesis enzyme MnmG [Bacteroidales bacterium]